MGTHQALVQNLGNTNNFLGQIPILPVEPIPDLNSIWEFNIDTGMPIFPDPQPGWKRYLPTSLLATPCASDAVGRQFVNGMRGNRRSFTINCDAGNSRRDSAIRSLLRMILSADMKKFNVQIGGAGKVVFTKNSDPLIPFDDVYPQGALQSTVNWRGKSNAVRGWMGPGSYRCRDGHCIVTGPCMTQSAVVRWGPLPHQVVNLQKRFTCLATNVVYLLHCAACIQEGNWSTYVGQTEQESDGNNMHTRFSMHTSLLQNAFSQRTYALDATFSSTIVGMLNGDIPDPHQLLRDPFVHFNYIHTPNDRRYNILNGGFPNKGERLHHERFYQVMCGNCEYSEGTRSGSLNY